MTVRIGVRLPVQASDLGEWLADAAAFDAAGADALWVDHSPDAEFDPLTLTAALAAVTYRSLLVTSGTTASATAAGGTAASGTAASGTAASGTTASATAAGGTAAGGTAASGTAASGTTASGTTADRALTTVKRLSRGRLRLVDPASPEVLNSNLDSNPDRTPGDDLDSKPENSPAERWLGVEAPDGRESWRATLAEAEEQGYQGVVVPAHPRLLDILRNPGDPGERLDLQLAQG